MFLDYVSLVYRVTYWHHSREDWLVSNLARKYTGGTIFTACIVYATVCSRLSIVCWHFHTCCTGKIFEGHVVTVLEWGSHQIGPRYFGFFSLLFTNFGGTSYTCYWGYLPIFFSNFMGASYTRVQPNLPINRYQKRSYSKQIKQNCYN